MAPKPPSSYSWSATALGQVADFINGRAFKPSDWSKSGTPIIRIQNLNGGADYNFFEGQVEQRFAVHSGDLLFSWSGTRGTSFGPHFWHGPDGVLNQHIFNVRNLRGVERSFLFYALKSITGAIEGRAHGGAGIVHITKGQLEAFEIPVPPLREQRRIAAILSGADAVIEQTEIVIESLQTLKKAMMQELLTRGLPGRHTRFKRTDIGEIPEEWQVVSLRRVADFQAGYAFKSAHFSTSGYRLLRGSNVSPGAIDWEREKTKFFPVERRGEVLEYLLQSNDVVIGMDRPFISSGFKIARITDADLPALLLQRVGRFVRLAPELDSEFLWVIARSGFLEGHLRVQQKGTDLPHISRDEILDSLIPLPSVDEQRAIALAITAINHRTKAENETLACSMAAKSALMSVLLTGELRVTPDEGAA